VLKATGQSKGSSAIEAKHANILIAQSLGFASFSLLFISALQAPRRLGLVASLYFAIRWRLFNFIPTPSFY